MVEAWLIAAATLFPLIVLKVLMAPIFKGKFGMVLKAGIGVGAAIGAAATVSICPALGLVIAVVAIILGEFFGTLGIYFGASIPFIGTSIQSAIAPISGVLMLILILNAVLFVFHILSILEILPVIGTIILIANIAIPLIIVGLIWGSHSSSIAGITNCFGLGKGPVKIPGTGGISIGT